MASSDEKKRAQQSVDGQGSHAKKRKREYQDVAPRSYQVAVYEVALRRNTIAVLDTGSGKTMIALMLIKKLGKELMETGGRRRLIVFLAPTVHLVVQQYETITIHTRLEVEHYFGAKGVDMWDAAVWQKEVSTYQVMVMTPQILLDALRKAYLSLDIVGLLILDECHHACGNHPYSRIMKEFYHNSTLRPCVFGMTASPVIRKCVSSTNDCQEQFSELESILDSKIYTIADRTEMDLFVPTPKELNIYYDSKLIFHENLKAKLGVLLSKYDASVTQLHDPLRNHYKDAADTIKASRKQLYNWYSKILYCLDELGLLCSIEAVKICMEAFKLTYSSATVRDFYVKNSAHSKSFLEEILHTFVEKLSDGHEVLLQTESGCLKALELGYISPKLYELMQIFHSFGMSSNVLCLIFVERIITAKAVEQVIKRIGYLSHFTVSHLTGGSSSIDALTPKEQKETLDLLRSGKINLLFTTDVAEEGLHIPDCSCVIRFDLPKTVRSYLQSRGRARKMGSHYIVMLERENMQQRGLLFNIIKSAHSMVDLAINRDPNEVVSKVFIKEEIQAYQVESTGAKVTADSSVAIIYRYCQTLPRDRYFIPKPNFDLTMCGGFYECTLTFPPNAALQTIVGLASRSFHMAKQLACLEACKKLHKLRALNDRLLPCIHESYENESAQDVHESAEGAGTTKRKELHRTSAIFALSGTWAHQKAAVTLQAYKIEFSCDQVGQNYGAFVLLIDTILDEDVSSVEMNLYSVDKLVVASISPCGPVELNTEQVEHAKYFHEIFFNGLFGKLFTVPNSSGTPREFLLKEDCSNSLWETSKMYLLLPLESSGTEEHQSIRINWKAINATAAVVRYMRAIYQDVAQDTPAIHSTCVSPDMEVFTGDIIHLANESAKPESLRNMVVMAVHTGKIYTVLDMATDLSAYSAFDGSDKSPVFSTFIEYFNKKHGLVLKHPGQMLLILKPTHNPHNLLSLKLNYEGGPLSKSSNSHATINKPQNHVHMPPELLFHIDVPLDVLKSFYLLPSLMHRMESLMLASQLRKEVGHHPDNSSVSIFLILEAITTSRCCEDFSLERLELLGDSVLKYAMSCHIFLKFPEKHEGQLSSSRSKVICNATLHRLGSKRGIQGYIRDSPFDPRVWMAPGQLSLYNTPCTCDYENKDMSNSRFSITENSSIVIGKPCARGHRWICSKTVSDCVEAVIGAYYVDGGLSAALAVLRWLGIDTEVEQEMLEMARRTASLWSYLPMADEIKMLELKLSYSFIVKGLLVEALSHASLQELGANYCYQRLEFLGDSVLDLLITWHLFNCHKDADPGELSVLRSASVNNENFAQIAVKHNFHQHLQHCSGLLVEQITEYVKIIKDTSNAKYLFSSDSSSQGPKVLGDIVESIAGALLIDTKLDLDKVWKVFEPLLSPIVTPENLELPAFQELTELCSQRGYFLKSRCVDKGDMVVVVLEVQLEDIPLSREVCAKNRRAAKVQAASLLLKDLGKRGLTHSRYSSRRNQHEEVNQVDSVNEACHCRTDMAAPTSPRENETVKTEKRDESELVHLKVKRQKGGPRTAIYDLCKKWQWPLPSFQATETKPSNRGTSKGPGEEEGNNIPGFVSSITMHIPGSTVVIRLVGEKRTDKKSSFDSAALAMLYELQAQGRCLVEEI